MNPHDAPDPPDPERDTDRSDYERLFKTLSLNRYASLVRKKDNPKELYVVQMEDPDVEMFIEDDYSWKWPEGWGENWEDQVDEDCIADLVTDAWTGEMKPLTFRTKSGPQEIQPLTRDSFGEGTDSFISPNFPDLELRGNPDPPNYKPIVKLDLDLAKVLVAELEHMAYRHIGRPYPDRKLGEKANKAYIKMIREILKVFPDAD